MEFDYRIIGVISMILMLIIGIIIITGVTSRSTHASDLLTMQLGLG